MALSHVRRYLVGLRKQQQSNQQSTNEESLSINLTSLIGGSAHIKDWRQLVYQLALDIHNNILESWCQIPPKDPMKPRRFYFDFDYLNHLVQETEDSILTLIAFLQVNVIRKYFPMTSSSSSPSSSTIMNSDHQLTCIVCLCSPTTKESSKEFPGVVGPFIKSGVHVIWPFLYLTKEQCLQLWYHCYYATIHEFKRPPFCNSFEKVFDVGVYSNGLRIIYQTKAMDCSSCKVNLAQQQQPATKRPSTRKQHHVGTTPIVTTTPIALSCDCILESGIPGKRINNNSYRPAYAIDRNGAFNQKWLMDKVLCSILDSLWMTSIIPLPDPNVPLSLNYQIPEQAPKYIPPENGIVIHNASKKIDKRTLKRKNPSLQDILDSTADIQYDRISMEDHEYNSSLIQKEQKKINIDIHSSLAQQLIQFVKIVYPCYNKTLMKDIWKPTHGGFYIIQTFKGEGSRFCMNLFNEYGNPGADHNSETVHVIIMKTGIQQRCKCRCLTRERRINGLCSEFKSPSIPLPTDILQLLWPTTTTNIRNNLVITNNNNRSSSSGAVGDSKYNIEQLEQKTLLELKRVEEERQVVMQRNMDITKQRKQLIQEKSSIVPNQSMVVTCNNKQIGQQKQKTMTQLIPTITKPTMFYNIGFMVGGGGGGRKNKMKDKKKKKLKTAIPNDINNSQPSPSISSSSSSSVSSWNEIVLSMTEEEEEEEQDNSNDDRTKVDKEEDDQEEATEEDGL